MGKVFYPWGLVCKVEYCGTERQDGVIALGASYIQGLMSGFLAGGLTCKIELVTWNQRIPPFLHLCVRHLQCKYSEQLLDTGNVLD